jgi:Rrf2 family nitric oxide-sensitive transcriptional repressor
LTHLAQSPKLDIHVQFRNSLARLLSMISRTAEYALRAVVFLGNQQGKAQTTAAIAKASDAPADYLAKVMQSLGRAEVVKSRRGLNGGFTLGRDASDISLLQVVEAVDKFQRIHRCPLGRPAHGNELCPLHQRMDNVMANAEEVYRATSVADVLDGVSQATSCKFPATPQAAIQIDDLLPPS